MGSVSGKPASVDADAKVLEASLQMAGTLLRRAQLPEAEETTLTLLRANLAASEPGAE